MRVVSHAVRSVDSFYFLGPMCCACAPRPPREEQNGGASRVLTCLRCGTRFRLLEGMQYRNLVGRGDGPGRQFASEGQGRASKRKEKQEND